MSARLATRLLEPDYWTTPNGPRWRPEPARTYGPEVADVCALAGFAPDPQQELALDLVFAIRPDGSPLTFEFNLMVCRQNLKTGFFKQVVLGWLFVTQEPSVIWSSHEMSTTRDSMGEIHELISEAPALSKYLPTERNAGLYEANGQERIELTTGQKVNFKARRETGGRGLAKRKLILDEFFAVKPAMLGSLIPLMLAQHHPQVLYGSSAPRPESESLREVRDRGRDGRSPRLTHIEWLAPREACVDPDCTHPKDALARGIDCALDREDLLRAANPTLSTGRITMETLRDARQAMPPSEYMVECLGWAAEPTDGAGPAAIDLRTWQTLSRPTAPEPTRAAVVLDVEPDRSATTIGLVGNGPDGKPLALVDVHGTNASAIEALIALRDNLTVLEVALHPSGQAGVLAPALAQAGITFRNLVHKDMSHGCSGLQVAVETGQVLHVGQPQLDVAIAAARIRTVAEAQLWDRRNTAVQLGPVVAVSVALQRWLELTAKPDEPPPPPVRAADTPTVHRREFDAATVGF